MTLGGSVVLASSDTVVLPPWFFVVAIGVLVAGKLLYTGLKKSDGLRTYIGLPVESMADVVVGDGPVIVGGTARTFQATTERPVSSEDSLVYNRDVYEVSRANRNSFTDRRPDPEEMFESGPHGNEIARVETGGEWVPFVLDADGERLLVDPRAANYLLDARTSRGEKLSQVEYVQTIRDGDEVHVGGQIVETADVAPELVDDPEGTPGDTAENLPKRTIQATDGRVFLADGPPHQISLRLLTKHFRLPIAGLVLLGVGVYLWVQLG